jgi:alpha-1,3/alpha-1,6-mannosyltransferase
MAAQKQHTVFLHPDLGIGGAERLVIDAAVALQRRGHTVTIFTSHCDPQHCFDEARDGKPRPRLTTTHRSCTDTAA